MSLSAHIWAIPAHTVHHVESDWPWTAAVWPLWRLHKIPGSHFLSQLLLTGTIGCSWELPPEEENNTFKYNSSEGEFWLESSHFLSSFSCSVTDVKGPILLFQKTNPQKCTASCFFGIRWRLVKALCWGWFHSLACSNNFLADKPKANYSRHSVLGQGATDPGVLPMCQIHWCWIKQKTKGQYCKHTLALIRYRSLFPCYYLQGFFLVYIWIIKHNAKMVWKGINVVYAVCYRSAVRGCWEKTFKGNYAVRSPVWEKGP